jgi:hypothetical protein
MKHFGNRVWLIITNKWFINFISCVLILSRKELIWKGHYMIVELFKNGVCR